MSGDRESEFISVTEGLTLTGPRDVAVLEIRGEDGKRLVAIKPDGSVEYGENYTPEAAAKRFWDCMADLMPACPRCSQGRL